MDITEYKFRPNYWPPPEDRKAKDSYLFGFDEDNQPYIIRWENQRGYEGWIAATLSENKSSNASAVPRHYTSDTVDKLIRYWSDAPCLLRTVFKVQSQKKRKKNRHDRDYRYEREEEEDDLF